MTHRRLATHPNEIQHLWLKDDGEPMNSFIITSTLIGRKYTLRYPYEVTI
jgi:hypothetical protein